MIAAKVRTQDGVWRAWLAVKLDHVRQDAEMAGEHNLATLHEIPIGDVVHMDDYLAGKRCVEEAELTYGLNAAFSGGHTTFCLGPLMLYDAHRELP